MFITDFEISFMLLKVFNHVFSHDFSSFVRDVFFSQVFRKWKKSLPYKAVIDYMFMLLVGYVCLGYLYVCVWWKSLVEKMWWIQLSLGLKEEAEGDFPCLLLRNILITMKCWDSSQSEGRKFLNRNNFHRILIFKIRDTY